MEPIADTGNVVKKLKIYWPWPVEETLLLSILLRENTNKMALHDMLQHP